MNIRISVGQRAAVTCVIKIAGALLCVVLIGCGDKARAVSVPVGEPLEEAFDGGTASGEAGGQAPSVPQSENGERQTCSVIYVHVCGAVNVPGVVLLPEGSRGQAALEAAGGFAEDAAEDAVNLAQTLTDGMQLYFPTREEAESLRESEHEAEAGLVNINTAGVELLCTLPGIGEARAKAIVADRETNGAFQNPEDIMRVSGIKDSAYDKIRDLITVK